MRRLRKLLLLLVLVALTLGHYLYWYAARERPAAPEPGGLPARLLAAGAYDACVWAPFPHQNLGVLAGTVDDGTAYLDAAARMAEMPPPVLPSFGPFALPPSKEIVACSDWNGQRFMAVARVYPALAVTARLAGRIAGNPWLAGGEVVQSGSEDGAIVERVIRVAWQDGYWTLSSGAPAALDAISGEEARLTESLDPALAVVRLEREVSRFPAGVYQLHRRDGGLELALTRPAGGGELGPEIPDPLEGQDPAERPVLLAVAGAAWPAAEPEPLPPAALALFDTGEGAALELPAMAVLQPPGKERFRLPGQGLAGLLLRRLPKRNVDGWQIVAIDDPSARRAQRLTAPLTALAPPDGGEPATGRLVLGLWFEPRPTLRLVSRVRGALEKIPLVDRRQVREWRDAEILLEPLKPCRRVALTAVETPPSFRLRFLGCGGAPGG